MLSNGVEGSSEVRMVDIVAEAGADRSRHTVTWKGFFISESQNTISKLAAAGGCIVGSICTGVGIQQRIPAISITFPILTLIAEAAYFSCRAYNYFKAGNHDFEDIIHFSNGDGVERIQVSKTGHDVTAIQFFEDFKNDYLSADLFDLQKQQSLFKQLKDQFPDYFNNHPDEQNQSILMGEKQCKSILEGISKRYKLDCSKSQPVHEAKGYQILTSVDNGDCFYDAIWQGLGKDHQGQLLETYGKEMALSQVG